MTAQNEIKPGTEKIKQLAVYKLKKRFLHLILFIIFFTGVWYYKNPVIVLFGIITCTVEFVFEYYCIENGVWAYKKNIARMLTSKIPMSVPVMYFLTGAVGAIYVLFRLGYSE